MLAEEFMKKLLVVVGARPQFIKAAPVSRALEESGKFQMVLVHTGQHYDANMSRAFFEELEIPEPNFNLGVGSGGHGFQTGEVMKRLEPVMEKEAPDAVMVFGDTNSTLAGALTAVKLQIPVAHVEAGLRSFNRKMPEEINRILTDHISSFLFCPTTNAVRNLEKEGIRENVFHVGDVMYDAALSFAGVAEKKTRILTDLQLMAKHYVLVTVHRAENTDNRERLFNILLALRDIAQEMTVVLPLHPRTRKMVVHFGLGGSLDGVRIIDPVGFLDMVSLERNARLIITDSGGVQKEAYFHRVPCVTLRDETEWIETVQTKWNVLASLDQPVGSIVEIVSKVLRSDDMRIEIDEYGDGNASMKIMERLRRYLNAYREAQPRSLP
jgi:UDP-GlcNAc3NAcA epimerase